jgi:hypothetical protein
MKTYILKQQVKDILYVMEKTNDDVFELHIDNSSGIGTTITLSTDIIYNGLVGKFVVKVVGNESW